MPAGFGEYKKSGGGGAMALIENVIADSANEEMEAKDKVQEANDETDKRGTIADLLNLGSMNGALHEGCDFTLDNFEVRQVARDGEVEALKQAKAIFSGAGFGR